MLVRAGQARVARKMVDEFAKGRRLDAQVSQWDSFLREKDEEAQARKAIREKKKLAAERRAAETGWGGSDAAAWNDFSDVSEESEEDGEDEDFDDSGREYERANRYNPNSKVPVSLEASEKSTSDGIGQKKPRHNQDSQRENITGWETAKNIEDKKVNNEKPEKGSQVSIDWMHFFSDED